MLGRFTQPPGDGNCLRRRGLSPQVEFSGMTHFTAHNVVGLLKVLQLNVNDRVVKNLRVYSSQGISHLRQRLPLDPYAIQTSQADVPIGLHSYRLIEFRREWKIEFQYIGGMQLIAPIAVLEHWSLLAISSSIPVLANDLP